MKKDLVTLLVLSVFGIILFAYYPAIKAGFSEVDDTTVLRQAVAQGGDWSLRNIFTPGGSMYFRPITDLLSNINYKMFGTAPEWLHLQNILIHACSALLIFWLCTAALAEYGIKNEIYPFLAALLFGLHPVAVESVAWISGHSDLLAAFFVLSACAMLFHYRKTVRKRYLVVMVFLLGCAILSKEVSFAFVPGIFLLLSGLTGGSHPGKSVLLRQGLMRGVLLLVGILCLVVALVWMRWGEGTSKLGKTVQALTGQPVESLALICQSFGFHFKKVFAPWPLSFAITEVHPVYAGVGLILALLCLGLFLAGRSLRSRLFLGGVLFLIPALPVALGYIAWTPYAERYAYIAMAFIVLAVMVSLGTWFAGNRYEKPLFAVTICVVMVFGATTTLRAALWADQVSFFADAVHKSPGFYKIRNVYGSVLQRDSQMRAAEAQYRQAYALHPSDADSRYFIHMGGVRAHEKRYQEARVYLEQAMARYSGSDLIMAYEYMTQMLSNMRLDEKSSADKDAILKDLRDVTIKHYAVDKDPVKLYRIGQYSLELGLKDEARRFFQEAYEKLPKESMYKPLSKKYIDQI